MRVQSTNHLLMIEPGCFYANPETMDTNVYQLHQDDAAREELQAKALQEFKNYRDALVNKGVIVTSAKGYDHCPDMVFPNWMSTHQEGRFFLYPMLNENRRAEIAPEIIDVFAPAYTDFTDWRDLYREGLFLESTASIVSDHVNKIGYAGLSARTDKKMVERWGDLMGYEMVTFETRSHAGKPVYHTDFLMYIGTEMAGFCTDCLDEKDRGRVLNKLRETHDVLELSMDQLRNNCGNALEVVGEGNQTYLTMSESALHALSSDQEEKILEYYPEIIAAPLDTMEKYGGGSARCMLMEIFCPKGT